MSDRLLLVFLSLFFILPAAAQDPVLTLPDEIEVIDGRLVVTFNDSVDEARATALMRELGYEITSVSFQDVFVVARSEIPIPQETVDRLAAMPGVHTVEPRFLDDLTADAAQGPGYLLLVELESALSVEAARTLVEEATGLPVTTVRKPPNDIVLTVPEDDEEAIIEALEAREEVKYVSYQARPTNG